MYHLSRKAEAETRISEIRSHRKGIEVRIGLIDGVLTSSSSMLAPPLAPSQG
jgi:hypothetical protein